MKFTLAWGFPLLLVFAAIGCDPRDTTPDDDDGPAADGSGGTQATGGTGGGAGGDLKETDPDPKDPVIKGERGSSCDSTNDCEGGLSCIVTAACPAGVACANKSCQPSNFDILGTGKQCDIVQCASRADCCGDMPQEAPAKCDGRDRKCFEPSLPECVATSCTDDDGCSGGGTCHGSCYYDGEDCKTSDECVANTCVIDQVDPNNNYCSLSSTYCTSDANCATNSCGTLYCDCTNPEYDPTDPICTDEDCEGICGFACEDELCVVDTSCMDDAECALATPFCDAGACVECLSDDDCDDEPCLAGRCGPECEQDTQCGLFEACQGSECVYVGCQTDRECVLGATPGDGQDPRLSTCRIEAGVGTCVFPCEIDAQCAPTEVCLEGVCEYIGCETDNECKTIVGLHNLPVPTLEQPWTTKAVCRGDTDTP